MSSPPPSAPQQPQNGAPRSSPAGGGTSPSSRIEITGGGQPSPEELAALTIALQPVAVEVDDRPDPRASWEQAALLEGVGFRPFNSHTELARYHRSIA